MKRCIAILCAVSMVFWLAACTNAENEAAASPSVSAAAPTTSPAPTAVSSAAPTASPTAAPTAMESEPQADMQIRVRTEQNNEIVFQLNDTAAARSLYCQLPLTLPVEDFGGSEKIFYPPQKLDVSDTPMAKGAAGTLAYYEPWGDVAIYYGECNGAEGLYALGEAVSGIEFAAELAGEVVIEKEEDSEKGDGQMNVQIEAGGQAFTATMQDNEAARAFMERLPMTVDMGELNGNEKYYYLSEGLPAKSARPPQINAGDLMLFGSDCLVLFYESFSTSYSYTPLATISDPSKLKDALGNGNVQVTFSRK